MLIDFEILCEFITDEYKVDYIIIDNKLRVKKFSKATDRFFDENLVAEKDIREYLYELVGHEDDLYAISSSNKKDFHLLTVNKNSYYMDIHIRNFHNDGALVIFIADTTESTICNQKILQDRNKQELISRELSHKSIIKDKMIALQSRQAQMGEMIGAIAHQWRQPLNIISTGIQNLKYDYMEGKLEDEAYIKKFIDKNKKTVKFMSSTIDDFRNFFKPEKEKRDFRINEPIHHIIDILNPTLLHHKITIEATQLSNIVVSGYPNELGQVLINIINNAKDALFENHIEDKYIKIYTIQDQECISIVIEDNARGIPEEIIDTIFDPYFSTKLDKNGTGLGLYMSKIIIEDHMSGRITVKNIAEGAQFIISLKKN